MKYLTWCGHYFCTNNCFMERETYPYVLIIFVRDGICSHEVTELIIQNNNSPVFRRSHNIKVGQEIFDRVQFFLKGGMTNIFQDSFHIERLLVRCGRKNCRNFTAGKNHHAHSRKFYADDHRRRAGRTYRRQSESFVAYLQKANRLCSRRIRFENENGTRDDASDSFEQNRRRNFRGSRI